MMTLGASISLEFLQNLVNPKRVFDPIDICFNCMGSLFSILFCVIVQSFRSYGRNRDDLENGAYIPIDVNLNEISSPSVQE